MSSRRSSRRERPARRAEGNYWGSTPWQTTDTWLKAKKCHGDTVGVNSLAVNEPSESRGETPRGLRITPWGVNERTTGVKEEKVGQLPLRNESKTRPGVIPLGTGGE